MQTGNLKSKKILTYPMEAKIIKVTDKGQIALPVRLRESAGISEGDSVLVVQEGSSILIQKVSKDKFRDLLKHSESVAKKFWSSKDDDVWDKL